MYLCWEVFKQSVYVSWDGGPDPLSCRCRGSRITRRLCASCPWEAGAAQRGPLAVMMASLSLCPMAAFQPKRCMFQVEQTGGWAAGAAA